MIQILSGPVRSGKTTALMRWAADRKDTGGVLSPDVEGFRRLFNVFDKTSIPWQKGYHEADTDQQIGRFVFDSLAFRQAQQWLGEHLANPALTFLLLDEIGPLELSGHGWDAWLKSSIPRINEKTLILVVRESLVRDVIRRYGLQEAGIITRSYFIAD